MNRIEAAIREGRCVLAIGKKAAENGQVTAELERCRIPVVHLGGDPAGPIGALDAQHLGPVLSRQGGIIVLVDPEPASDGRGLSTIGDLAKSGPHKPKIFVAAKAFNPFQLPISLRTLKVEQLKFRAVDFLRALPVAAVAGEEKALSAKDIRKAKRQEQTQAPRPIFVGREDEIAQLQGFLTESDGTILVTGPDGVGKRWLVEHVLDNLSLKRLPDLTVARGVGADALLARAASAAHAQGDSRLRAAIQKREARPTPAELTALLIESFNADAFADHVWVIHGLQSVLDKRRAHFARVSRLEMYLDALLKAQTKLKIIFVTPRMPAIYAEGALNSVHEIPLKGLAGKTLHGIFEACHLTDTPRDKFGPIVERTHGHPMAVRFFALTAKAEGDLDELIEQNRFLKMETLDDQQALRRHIKRRVSELDAETRKRLATVALLRDPGTTEQLRSLGLNRNQRLELLCLGLLDQTPVQDNRRYFVHPLVAHHLEYREVYDFSTMEALGRTFLDLGHAALKSGDNTQALALHQEANRLLIEARLERNCTQLPYPDQDALVDNIYGLARRRSPRIDIARMRTNEALKVDPYNPELLLAHAEIRAAENAKEETVVGVFTHAAETCPTPEVFHAAADYHFAMHARGKAASALERGIATFPDDGRLQRRLSTIYLDQNRLDDAIACLKQALAKEPSMPETYGLLGEAHTRRGTEGWEQANQYLEEAMRLDPDGARTMVRVARLEREKSMIAPNPRETGLERAEALLTKALEVDKSYPDAQALKAAVILDRGGDVEQAEWLLKQIKRRDNSFVMVQKARVKIRRGKYDEVEKILNKAIKKEKSNHTAFAAQAEFWEAQGQVFHAFESYRAAKERTPKSSPARIGYDQHLTRLGKLIESGHAAEMMKVNPLDTKVVAADSATADEAGPRRDAGKTTIRRTKDKTGAEAPETEAVETEAPEAEAPETEAVETEAPETEAPEAEAPEAEAVETEAPEAEAVETEAPETEAPETEAPEAEAPEAEAVETEAPETETPETETPTA
jgi:tetratricopeptide (TPR) repeat protein